MVADEHTASLKAAARIDYKNVVLGSLPYLGMISFFQVYDGIVPLMLTGTFGLSNALTGTIVAIGSLLGLLMMPIVGALSDKCRSPLGRRTPFILFGSIVAAVAVPLIAVANAMQDLTLFVGSILLTLFSVCLYRALTVAFISDITPRPLRTKADSIRNIVGYSGTGLMLAAVVVMLYLNDSSDYLPLFMLQGAVIGVCGIVFVLFVREPRLVDKMHADSLKMGIAEEDVYLDDSPEAGGKNRIADKAVLISLFLLLFASFFYDMGFSAITANISRYAASVYEFEDGVYAIINIVTILGAVLSYVPLANLSLHVGRKKWQWQAQQWQWCAPSFCGLYLAGMCGSTSCIL